MITADDVGDQKQVIELALKWHAAVRKWQLAEDDAARRQTHLEVLRAECALFSALEWAEAEARRKAKRDADGALKTPPTA